MLQLFIMILKAIGGLAYNSIINYKLVMQLNMLSIQEKIQTIFSNKNKLPVGYQNDAVMLKNLKLGEKMEEADCIKIQTFYRLVLPAINSFYWQQPNEQVKYPVAAVAVDKNEEMQAYPMDVKTAIWIQSGGTRIIPIKTSSNLSQIQQIVKLTHCAIFIQPETQTERYRQFVTNYLKIIGEQNKYPILFLGKSCIYGLQTLLKSKLLYEIKNDNIPSEIFISYNSQLFRGLDLTLRLQVQNKKKITYPNCKIKANSLHQQNLEVCGYMKSRAQPLATIFEDKKKLLYFILNNPTEFENPQIIQFWHCAILNFIDITKGFKKEVNEKKIEKILLAYHKIVHKFDRECYKIQ